MHSGRFRKTFHVTCAVLCFFTGLSVALYPWISSLWNSHTQTKAITGYSEILAEMDAHRYEEMWKQAEEFNENVISTQFGTVLKDEDRTEYEILLNVENTGMIGYLSIETIHVSLPVYHGTDASVLRTGAGHAEWSSLPTGTTGSHCVITGHSGLPSSTLFTDLHKLKKGDTFTLQVLDRTMTYEVCTIETCLPDETESLRIEENEDLCTLVTCTPYSVNSHRLLVTGRRVTENNEIIVSDEEIYEADIGIACAVVIVWSVTWIVFLNRKRRA